MPPSRSSRPPCRRAARPLDRTRPSKEQHPRNFLRSSQPSIYSAQQPHSASLSLRRASRLPLLSARSQAVEKGGNNGSGVGSGYVPPVPQTPSYESKPIKLRKQAPALDQNSWTRSLAKAAVSVGLAPDSWVVRDQRDVDDAPVQLNTDPRLAEDFAAECKVFYSKANDGRAQRAAMLADGVVRGACRFILFS